MTLTLNKYRFLRASIKDVLPTIRVRTVHPPQRLDYTRWAIYLRLRK